MTRLKHLHRKKSKGKEYYYFDTGTRNADGKKIFAKIVGPRDPAFPRAYALACESRKQRRTVVPIRTFEWLLKVYEKSPEFTKKKPNTQRSYLNSFAKASKLLQDFEGRSTPLAQIETRDILNIRDKLIDGQGANQTVRSLSALFTWASHKGRQYMPENPASDIELFDEGEHEPWPPTLVEEALQDERVRAVVGLLYFTGQRIGDVLRMRWSDITNGMIRITQDKTGKLLDVPLTAELSEILAELPKRGMTILAKSTGDPYTYNGMRPKLKAWIREHGREDVIHGLRKNAVNALLEAECSIAEVAAITGQSLKMVEHYAKLRNQTKLGQAAIIKFDSARQKRNKAGT